MRRTIARTAPSLPSASYGQPGADKNQGPVAHQTQVSIFKKEKSGQWGASNSSVKEHVHTRNTYINTRNTYVQGTHICIQGTLCKEHLWRTKLKCQGTHTYKEHIYIQGTPVAHQIELSRDTYIQGTYTYIQETPVAHQIEPPT
jgi:hypothetical protein